MQLLLSGKFDPKTLTIQQMDSILATHCPSAKSDRYCLYYENKKQLYRHSFFAEYYLIDTQKNDTLPLSDQPVRDALMSPNGKYVVYAKADNNLYIYKIDFKTEVAITGGTNEDLGLPAKNQDIYNGISDWLYEEEFGITTLFAFSPDSKQLAFVQLDEKQVPTFQWQTFLEEHEEAYPHLHSLRYPKAGAVNATANVCVYDMYYKTIRTMQLPTQDGTYIPRIAWTPMPTPEQIKQGASSQVIALLLNRDQTRMDVCLANPKSTVCKRFYTEESKQYYIDYQLFDQWQWLDDGRVIVLSEKEGYTQAYIYSSQGIQQTKLTPQHRDITQLYGYDTKKAMLYYQAANTPITRQAYALDTKKQSTHCITYGEGWHNLRFSNDYSHFIDAYQNTELPTQYTLYETSQAIKSPQNKLELLMDNLSVKQAWQDAALPNKEFFTFITERGDTLNAWRILPADFDAKKQYPVVMMQYSGPASQRVTNTWKKRFGHYLAVEGYIVVCVDGRGTAARGREWRNATYMQLGKHEAEDQISAAMHIRDWSYVDATRIAICGWSYGGYQTIMCMSQQPLVDGKPLWKCGMAIAPVTSWKLYDSAYTERYMRRPQVNEFGYQAANVINLADQLKGQLLIVHGLADDNVHVQHTWLYVDALVQAGKQFEMQIYPDDNHFIRKGNNYQHLHERLMKFLNNNL